MARHDGRDDDIQFLYQAEAAIECPACHRDLGHMSPDQRNAHCNDHFAEESRAGSSTPSPRKQVAGGQKKQRFQSRLFSTKMNSAKEKNDAFWYLSCNGAPPSNFTPGLIPVLKKALAKSHSKGLIQKAYLCSPAVVHVVSEGWDRGWGCGYRNYLMACTALMGQEQQPRYTSLLESPSPPGIRRLQKLIEEAWKEGYDQEGAEQLKNKLTGTSKWIGTAELYVALTYRGVPARLVDFELNRRGPELLVNWIIDYFSQGEGTSRHADINQALLGASPIIITDKPPIVLQHSGHSRTVIGFERKKDGSIDLLMFDPSRRIPDPLRQLAISELPSQLSSHGDQRSHSPLKHKLSPSKVVNKVFHPQKSRRKRNASDASIEHARAISSNAKRVRAGDEVIVISDDEGGGESTGMRPTEVNWNKAADIFRVKTKTLEKKDKYQVLYFPMTDPLTPSERQARKVVTSQRIPPVNSV